MESCLLTEVRFAIGLELWCQDSLGYKKEGSWTREKVREVAKQSTFLRMEYGTGKMRFVWLFPLDLEVIWRIPIGPLLYAVAKILLRFVES